MQNRIVGVIGPKGSGKTYSVVQELVMKAPRVAVFDMVREPAYLVCEPITGQLRRFAESISQPEFRVTYRPVVFERDGDDIHTPELDKVVTACYLRGDMTLVIDESHLLLTARRCPTMLLVSNWIGRHRRFSFAYVAQTLSTVSVPLRRNTDEFYFWRITEPIDIDGISDRCGKDVAIQVANLRATDDRRHEGGIIVPGQRLHWTKTEGIVDVTV